LFYVLRHTSANLCKLILSCNLSTPFLVSLIIIASRVLHSKIVPSPEILEITPAAHIVHMPLRAQSYFLAFVALRCTETLTA
jgi:hypothetical protein